MSSCLNTFSSTQIKQIDFSTPVRCTILTESHMKAGFTDFFEDTWEIMTSPDEDETQ